MTSTPSGILPSQDLLFLALLLHLFCPKALKAQKATANSSAEHPQLRRAATGDPTTALPATYLLPDKRTLVQG